MIRLPRLTGSRLGGSPFTPAWRCSQAGRCGAVPGKRTSPVLRRLGFVRALGLLLEVFEDGQDLLAEPGGGGDMAPAHLGLEDAVVGRIVVGPHEMRDLLVGEDLLEQFGLNLAV